MSAIRRAEDTEAYEEARRMDSAADGADADREARPRRNAAGEESAARAKRKRLDRRTLLRAGALAAGASLAGVGASLARAAQNAGAASAAAQSAGDEIIGENAPPWMKTPGRTFSGYGAPSHWEEKTQRAFGVAAGRAGTGASRTPLERLAGTITPSGLHFERHHNGVPDIDPGKHELVIHGMVKQPLAFTRETLLRYPLESQIHFVECAGNSGSFSGSAAQQATAGALNGLLSCSEWTGVRLATLLEEAGVGRTAKWVIAEGADAAAMSRSVPLEKCMDDAMIALYQNGEAIRPEQGYPMRLLLPGFEGNMNVKWLRRLNVMDKPVDARDETSHYTELMPGGKARQYMFLQEVKSAIIRPSFGMDLKAQGYYEISGLAWSGAGRIAKVEVSTDAGKSWQATALAGPVLSKSVTRFHLDWEWDGRPYILMSRATDEKGNVQPTRAAWVAQYAAGQPYHYNGIQSWTIGADGAVRNVYV